MAVVTITAIAGAAIGASRMIVNNRQKDSAASREVELYGRQQVTIDTNAAIQQESLVQNAATAMQTAQQASLQVEQNAMADQAATEVAAAVAGTAGQSVDLSITESEASAGRAQGAVDQREINALNQIDQASRDIAIAADAAKMDIELPNKEGDLLNVFSAGLLGFLGGR